MFTHVVILVHFNGTIILINDFLENIELGSSWEALVCRKRIQLRQYS